MGLENIKWVHWQWIKRMKSFHLPFWTSWGPWTRRPKGPKFEVNFQVDHWPPRLLPRTPGSSGKLPWDPVHWLKTPDSCCCCPSPSSCRGSARWSQPALVWLTLGLCRLWTFSLQRPQRGDFFRGPLCNCPTQVSWLSGPCPWRGGTRCRRAKMARTSICPTLDWSCYTLFANFFFAKCLTY